MKIFIHHIWPKQYSPTNYSDEPTLVDINPSFKIKQLKEKIAKQTNIPSSDQFLSIEGRTLEDEQTLVSCDYIKDGSTISMVIWRNASRQKYQVFVSILRSNEQREVIKLEIFYQDTVTQVKYAIYELTSIPIEKQRIIFAGKQLEDDRVFSNYGIQKESTVHLVIRDKVRVADVPPVPPEVHVSSRHYCTIL